MTLCNDQKKYPLINIKSREELEFISVMSKFIITPMIEIGYNLIDDDLKQLRRSTTFLHLTQCDDLSDDAFKNLRGLPLQYLILENLTIDKGIKELKELPLRGITVSGCYVKSLSGLSELSGISEEKLESDGFKRLTCFSIEKDKDNDVWKFDGLSFADDDTDDDSLV